MWMVLEGRPCSLLPSARTKKARKAANIQKSLNYKMKKDRQLISEEYRNINISLHESDVYGEKNHSINDRVLYAIDACLQIGMCKSTLDYGCGKGVLIKKLRNHFGSSLEINGYDPCVAEYDIPYSPADIVTCFDVLVHIEPDKINYVLDDIS